LGASTTAILGPSGSGKTSLLEAIAGLRKNARGKIVVDGETFLDDARAIDLPPHRRRVGLVPQHAALFPHLDVEGNVAFATHGRRHRVFDETIEILELGALLRRHASTLSGGEKQRVALARILQLDPRATIDNVVDGVLRVGDDATELVLAGGALSVPARDDAREGDRATYAVAAEDVLLSSRPLEGVSARNVIEGRVAR